MVCTKELPRQKNTFIERKMVKNVNKQVPSLLESLVLIALLLVSLISTKAALTMKLLLNYLATVLM